jgi:ubiquitin carboxyl-terminal hydrolase 7
LFSSIFYLKHFIFYILFFDRRILLFPKGNNQTDFVSVYLEVADPMEQGCKESWHNCAQFSLVVSNPQDPTNFYSNSK